MFKDTKEVIRNSKSNKDRQHNVHKKSTTNDLNNPTQKTKDRATQTALGVLK